MAIMAIKKMNVKRISGMLGYTFLKKEIMAIMAIKKIMVKTISRE